MAWPFATRGVPGRRADRSAAPASRPLEPHPVRAPNGPGIRLPTTAPRDCRRSCSCSEARTTVAAAPMPQIRSPRQPTPSAPRRRGARWHRTRQTPTAAPPQTPWRRYRLRQPRRPAGRAHQRATTPSTVPTHKSADPKYGDRARSAARRARTLTGWRRRVPPRPARLVAHRVERCREPPAGCRERRTASS